MRGGASSYLLKSINTENFFKELDRLNAEIQEEKPATIYIKQSKDIGKTVTVHSILYVDIEDRAPAYHLDTGKTIPGKYYRGQFNDAMSELTGKHGFVIAGNGLAVNMSRVDSVSKTENIITFDDGTKKGCSREGARILAKAMKPKE